MLLVVWGFLSGKVTVSPVNKEEEQALTENKETCTFRIPN